MPKILPAITVALLALLLPGFSSCSHSDEDENIARIALHAEPLLNSDTDLRLINPTSISALGDNLIIKDLNSDSVILWVDAAKKEFLGGFLSFGTYPENFSRVTSVNKLSDKEGTIGLFDPAGSRLIEITLQPDSSPTIKREKEISVYYVAPDPVKLSNGCYVTSASYVSQKELFTLLSPQGMVIKFVGERPMSEEAKNYPGLESTAAYRYNVLASPEGDKIAAIGIFGEAAAFYKLEDDNLVPVRVRYNPAAEVDHIFEEETYRGVEGNVPLGYIGASSNSTGVFVLVSDRQLNSQEGQPMSANKIVQFDWDGTKVAEYTTDRRISFLATPEGSEKMYGIMDDNCAPTLVELTVIPTESTNSQETN